MNKTYLYSFIALIVSALLTLYTTNISENKLFINYKNKNAKEVYRVYLNGDSLGVIESKKELENIIDKEQSFLKDKYKVDKVYAPNNLKIVKEYTYSDKITSANKIYSLISNNKENNSFTINGYHIKIKGLEDKQESTLVVMEDLDIYVLDKKIFEDALEIAVKAFIDPVDYENYQKGIVNEIVETGKKVEKLYVENQITITEELISSSENIYMDTDSLSRFLIFGSSSKMDVYTVKDGDTIESLSYNNKISPEEFLIANNSFSSKDDLLYAGQKIYLGVVDPKIKVVEQDYVVSKKVIKYDIKYINDDTKYTGYEHVNQEGVNGLSLVTEKQLYSNGQLVTTSNIGDPVELKPTVDKIIVRGTKSYSSYHINPAYVPVNIGTWVWPTLQGYTISSNYGWRWGAWHDGIDISGTGYGSPVKAANNGIVVTSGYTGINGNYIVIAHSNGYHTYYGHLSTRAKTAGDIVYSGDIIGYVGNSGWTTGPHLHFSIYTGEPWKSPSINPLRSVY